MKFHSDYPVETDHQRMKTIITGAILSYRVIVIFFSQFNFRLIQNTIWRLKIRVNFTIAVV